MDEETPKLPATPISDEDIMKDLAKLAASAIDGAKEAQSATRGGDASVSVDAQVNKEIGEGLQALKEKKDGLLRRVEKSGLSESVRARLVTEVEEIFGNTYGQISGKEINEKQVAVLRDARVALEGKSKKLRALIREETVRKKQKDPVVSAPQIPDIVVGKSTVSRRRKSRSGKPAVAPVSNTAFSPVPDLNTPTTVPVSADIPKSVSADAKILATVIPEPKAEPVVLDTTEALKEKRKKDLLASVPDGAIIEMTSFRGPIRFRRRGDEFFMGEKWETLGTDMALEGIDAGMIWERVEEDLPKPIVPGVDASKKETLYLKIDRLTKEVEEARAKWVEEDVKRTTLGKKFKSLFGMGQEEKKGEWQEVYEKLANELRGVEVEMMQGDMGGGKALSEEEMQEGTRKLLRYYKIDESVNLINERIRYKAKNQSFSEKIVDSLGALGRQYNSIPLKRKLMYAGIFAGLTIATTLSGGAAAGALASVVAARRAAAGLGTAVGTEALLESVQGRQKISKGEKEIAEQMRTLERMGFGEKSEMSLSVLNMLLEKDIASLDGKLQNEKRAKTWRKLGAIGFGALVGSGWLTRTVMEHGGSEAVSFAMNHLGGNTAADWVKEHTQTVFGKPEIAQPPSAPHLPPHPQVAVPEHGEASNTILPVNDAKTSIEPLPDLRAGMIDGFVHSDIVVEKGDSVWKIAGGLADKLGLEGEERTHFIDALKDQYGDVQLKAGETINFSEHGIDKDFIEHALEDAESLTPEQLHSIADNDAKIAEFAGTHPDVTLTDAKVDDILHGNTVADTVSSPSVVPVEMSAGAEIPASESGVIASPVQGPSVESSFTPELQPRVDDWYGQIFRVENAGFDQDWVFNKEKFLKVPVMSVFEDYRNHTSLTGLNSEQINNFGTFVEEAKRATGNENIMKELLRSNPRATTEDFLKKVATLIQPGTRLGLYTTTH